MNFDGNRKELFGKILSILSILFFLGLFVYYIRMRRDELASLRLAAPHLLFLSGAFFIFNVALLGMFNWIVLKALSFPIPFRICFFLSAMNSMINFLLPFRVGAGFRAGFLKKYYRLPLTLFVSLFASLVVLQLFLCSGIGLMALFWLTYKGAPFHFSIGGILFAVNSFTGWAIFLAPDIRILEDQKGLRRISRVIRGWDSMRHNPPVLCGALLTAFGTVLFSAASLFTAFYAFDIPVGIAGCLLLMASQVISGIISITPGALGFQELLGMYFSLNLSNSAFEIFAVLTTLRVVRMVSSLLVGLPGIYVVFRQYSLPDEKNVFII